MFASKDLFFSKPSGYQISRSVRLRLSATAYLNRTPAGAGNRKTWTWSGWVKRGLINHSATLDLFSASGTTFDNGIQFTGGGTNDVFRLQLDGNNAGVVPTAGVFRDASAWYHFIVAVDTTQATAANRVKIYINGIESTYGTSTYPSLNYDTMFNSTNAHNIGRSAQGSNLYFDGYLTEINFVDGQALTPSSFGETNTITGVWQPKKYTGTYGTNGFYLNFSDNSNNTAATIGKDYSGNGNNWTPNNISVTAGTTYDSMLDVPTLFADGGNGRGNYATLNPLVQRWSNATSVFSNANLSITTTNASSAFGVGTISNSSGKWYYEATVVAVGTNTPGIGVSDERVQNTVLTSEVAYLSNGQKEVAGTGTSYGATYTTNDVIGVAYDLDAATVTFYKNNTSQGSISLTVTANILPYCSVILNSNLAFNFGQRPFTYTPPTGFVALNTQNLPTPNISNGANYMAATLYTGTGSALTIANTVNGISFQPDFVWVKGRSGATDHALYDSVRGTTKDLVSNSTAAETTQATGLTAFGSTGFTVGALAKMNTNAATYVGWQWLAGTTSSSNTNGSITSTVSVGATQGFSVVTYTGTGANATVGHGLGVAPRMVIFKRLNAVSGWPVYHASIGNTGIVSLQSTAATSTSATYFNNTSPTSSVFTISTDTALNANTGTYVAYCFSEVAGYSKFGSYTGNGSADGPFVFCGFRPKFVMYKRTNTTGNWIIYDSSRSTFNQPAAALYPNLSNAEDVSHPSDFLSNGFKLRSTGADSNASGGTFIFAAFAENPFKNSLAR